MQRIEPTKHRQSAIFSSNWRIFLLEKYVHLAKTRATNRDEGVTAIKAGAAESFVTRPDPSYKVILFFGPDRGLVSERADKISQKIAARDGGGISRIDASRLNEEPDALSIELYSPALFEPISVVRVTDDGGLAARITPVVTDPPETCTLIIEAGDLKPGAALRKLTEGVQTAAAIGCYPDTAGALMRLIEQTLGQAGISASREVRGELQAHLGADRMVSQNEINKLLTYIHPRKQLTLQDIEAVCGDATVADAVQAIDAAFEGKLDLCGEETDRFFLRGIPGAQLVRNTLGHVRALHIARLRFDSTGSPKSAISGSGARFHFKRHETVERQLRIWTAAKLRKVLSELGESEQQCRYHPHLEDVIAARQLARIAIMAGAARKQH